MGLFDIFKKKTQLSEENLKENKMWDLWVEQKAESPYAELMTYQSEVNNGGHLQYFDNVKNTGDLQKELSVLEQILPQDLKENLKEAYKAYLIFEENEDDETVDEILDGCDNRFDDKQEDINVILKEYASKIEL